MPPNNLLPWRLSVEVVTSHNDATTAGFPELYVSFANAEVVDSGWCVLHGRPPLLAPQSLLCQRGGGGRRCSRDAARCNWMLHGWSREVDWGQIAIVAAIVLVPLCCLCCVVALCCESKLEKVCGMGKYVRSPPDGVAAEEASLALRRIAVEEASLRTVRWRCALRGRERNKKEAWDPNRFEDRSEPKRRCCGLCGRPSVSPVQPAAPTKVVAARKHPQYRHYIDLYESGRHSKQELQQAMTQYSLDPRVRTQPEPH